MSCRRLLAAILVVGLFAPVGISPGAQETKRPITHDVYDSWKSIQGTAISRDGRWLAYALVPQDGDGELVVRELASGAERRHPRGKEPVFTPDGRFLVFRIAAPHAEVDKAKKAGKKEDALPKGDLGVMTMPSGEIFTAAGIESFKLPEESSKTVAYLLARTEPDKKDAGETEKREQEATDKDKRKKKKEAGTDLIVRELASGQSTTIGGVTEYAWSKDGSWLAYAVSTQAGTEDGAFARKTDGGGITPLLQGRGFYKQLTFSTEGADVAFVSDRDEHAKDPSTSRFKLYHWTPAAREAREIAAPSTPGMPPEFSVSEHGALTFAKDGSAVFFGLARVEPPRPDGAPDPIEVDLWHYRDPLLQTVQQVRADDERKRSYLAVFHLKDRRLFPIGSPDVPDVAITEGVETLLGAADVPYRQEISWDARYHDYYLIRAADGTRQKILEKTRFDARLSPSGRYVLYYDAHEEDWMTVRVSDGRRANLTGRLPVRFAEEDWDTPDEPRPYGAAGWLDGDRGVLVYDRYDIWELQPDGAGARNLTTGQGRSSRMVFRYQRTDPEEKAIAATDALLLSAVDERTKASGWYRLPLTGAASPQKLVMRDKALGNLQKAKRADVFVFTASSFDEFPDLWVSGATFADMKKVSLANPQQAEFVWGRAELIDYRNADGRMLRGILFKPDNFDPARKYPLMVYIYEQLSDNLHRYVPPAPGHSINVTRYVSNGYVVLMPDIVYETGYPGASAYKCVIPAVQHVVSMGFVDPARIGIQGHSWGGYQITYLVTRTNLFRAVEAGASVANMISAYGGIRWETGLSRAFQYEKTQSRIGGPPWEMPTRYIENSPIFWVDRVQTPYLTMHNDDDGAVPWYQGIEFFTALRRLGKEAYLFNYNGEKHGLRQRENQKHFTVHMAEFFDHYLLGAPRPDWMEQGVPYLQRGTRDLTGIYQRKTSDR
jgi:dipeptidyl aminopeptidase/acylaminoacyl peptidase